MAYFDKKKGKWLARVKHDGLEVHHSTHDTEEEALIAESMAINKFNLSTPRKHSKAWFEQMSRQQVKALSAKYSGGAYVPTEI